MDKEVAPPPDLPARPDPHALREEARREARLSARMRRHERK